MAVPEEPVDGAGAAGAGAGGATGAGAGAGGVSRPGLTVRWKSITVLLLAGLASIVMACRPLPR